jgi:hypothetical protein
MAGRRIGWTPIVLVAALVVGTVAYATHGKEGLVVFALGAPILLCLAIVARALTPPAWGGMTLSPRVDEDTLPPEKGFRRIIQLVTVRYGGDPARRKDVVGACALIAIFLYGTVRWLVEVSDWIWRFAHDPSRRIHGVTDPWSWAPVAVVVLLLSSGPIVRRLRKARS